MSNQKSREGQRHSSRPRETKNIKNSRHPSRKEITKNQQKKRRKRIKKPVTFATHVKRFFLTLLFLLIMGIASGITLFCFYAKEAPSLDINYLESSGTTTIYDSSGNKILSLGTQQRSTLKATDVPQTLKNAITSIEDKRFYQHHGVDPIRILGAAIADLKNGATSLQGGSTIDQQLIKLSYFSTKKSDQTLKRKAQEAWLAVQLDKKYSKNKILTMYANKVFMGNGIYGMRTAAKYYYGKSLKQLDLAQTATLAGIPNAPSNYNPYSNSQEATSRRNTVLLAMFNNKKISFAQYQAAKSESISNGLIPKNQHQNTQSTEKAVWADAYLKQVLSELKVKGYDPYQNNLKVYTNLDMNVQQKLYELANSNTLSYPNDQLQVAATVINPNNGAIVGMIGARKTTNVTFGLNRAVQTSRTNASTAKPLLDYGPAIEYLGWPTYYTLDDSKYTYAGTTKELHDFDNQYLGKITMQSALIQSRNIPAIRALSAVGITRAQNFISQMGFKYKKTLELQNGIGLPSSTLQNAAAYGAFANNGIYQSPTYITSIKMPDGETRSFSSKKTRVMKKSTAYMVTDMLKKVISSSNGTGQSAAISGLYQAGKTGTNAYPSDITTGFPSNAIMDSWFNGYTRNYSISVWMGYDQPYQAGHYLTTSDSKLPQLFYKYLMSYISTGLTNEDWIRPDNVKIKIIDGIQYLYLSDDDDSDDDDILNSSSTSVTSTSSSSNSSSSSSSVSSDTSSSSINSSASTSTSDSSSSSSNSSQSSSSVSGLTP
ncbi:penicillin-binding protein [Ligilactobacillus sp. WILCCON 0076]|uniref:Penicillin-binding protein n=1 Tax=Ligilactobacillus ubinensis TaxID=2876789 RepID=A0A9X2FS14_9LACO|nr:transglycosylase domain-containing protein [Ligilactobacillus ubinensis]MCP0887823.1 penicillin-binding protein [Ligilactobacillus ubinensis]